MTSEISSQVWYLRYILILTSLFSIGTHIIIGDGPTRFHIFRFFTLQSNLFVLIWTVLAVVWRNSKNYSKLTGFLKGALTTYISITFIVFFILIEPIYDPVGLYWWTSLFNHYLNPWMFIADLMLAERTRFHWKWPVIWLIYPLSYLAFALIWGAAYGEYLYFFLNVEELGVGGLLIWTGILSAIFFAVGSLYTYVNRRYLSR